MRKILLTALVAGAMGVHAQESAVVTEVMKEEVAVADSSFSAYADTAATFRPYRWMAEGMASTSSGRTPFWLVSNRLGLTSVAQNNGYLRGGFFRDMQRDSRFSWGFGADIVVPYHFSSHFVIQQLYGEIRYRSLELTVGSKNRYMGIVNQELSSGDMAFSLNSRPVPQVFLSMPEYEWVPWTKNMLAVKGFVSIGMLTDWRWQRSFTHGGHWAEHVLYHTKGVFLRWGNRDKFPLLIEGGFEMGTLMGGKIHKVVDGKETITDIPSGFKDIIKSMLGMGGGDPDDPNQAGEISNCLGNHTGEWSVAATWAPRDADWSIKGYYQHYFEDHSQLFFDYAWRDMLVGMEITLPKNRFVDKFVYEYINTKDQSGPVYWDHTPDIPEQVSGADNYYNHYIYGGWQHWGMGIGNPLIISPLFNTDGNMIFKYNRIKGHHFGLSGRPTDELCYKVLLSATRTWGSYGAPTPNILRNFNALLEVGYSPRKLSGWDFRLGLAADGGKMLGKSVGAMLTVRKTGWL